MDVETIHLKRRTHLACHQVHAEFLGRVGIDRKEHGDGLGLADPVEAAVGLAVSGGGIVEFVPDGGREGDEVVEAGADGVGVDEEDLDVGPEDVAVDPGLALGGGDLLGVEPEGALGDVLADEPEETLGQVGGSGVSEEHQHFLALGDALA